jgi:glycosyltransferase involved in cell wall biosynthesis
MDALSALVSAPLMPWDALICTSRSVLATAQRIVEKECEYLAWRLRAPINVLQPQLPVIPLGVHCRDFEFSDKERAEARQALALAGDEIVALFVGRLSFHAKAHPHAMYVGLEAAAKRTGRKIALIQCGWFANDAIANAFKSGAQKFAPSVRALFTDGRNPKVRSHSWAAADLFITLSDNVQETFGLAPIEAMAAGLPVVATDWDGYRDTVRNGVDGYLIPTAMPASGYGSDFARAHESEDLNYDRYIGTVCRTVSVDLDELVERLCDLVASADLRVRLGQSGRQRALSEFDWGVIYKRYQDLWAELSSLRRAAQKDPANAAWLIGAPREAPSRLDPFRAFAEYPTRTIAPETELRLRAGASFGAYNAMIGEFLFGYEPAALPKPEFVAAVLEALEKGKTTPAAIAGHCACEAAPVVLAAAILLKMGLVRIAE